MAEGQGQGARQRHDLRTMRRGHRPQRTSTQPLVAQNYQPDSPMWMMASTVEAEVLFAEKRSAEARAALQRVLDAYASGKAGQAPPDFEPVRKRIMGR